MCVGGFVLQDAGARAREGKSYATRDDAKQEAFKCIELYCNTRRMHSSLGYRAPSDKERIMPEGAYKKVQNTLTARTCSVGARSGITTAFPRRQAASAYKHSRSEGLCLSFCLTAGCARHQKNAPHSTCCTRRIHKQWGAPCRIRTNDLGIRSPLLYPTELMAHVHLIIPCRSVS